MDDKEIGWYRKFNVPPSKYAPLTRWKQLVSWFIGNQIWYQKHPETGALIVSAVHPATGIKVLPDKEWFDRDFSDRTVPFLTDRPFFEALRELQLKVPMLAHQTYIEPKNSIALVSRGDEDSYFVLVCKSKRSFYSIAATDVEDSAEIIFSDFVTSSYNILFCNNIHQCSFLRSSRHCINSSFLFDCRNCEFCFGATNQRNKKYLWFNEQLSKEEWERRRAEVDLSKRTILDRYRMQFKTLMEQAIWPENFNEKAVQCLGEYLNDSTNMDHCWSSRDNAHDSSWVIVTLDNSYDNAYCAGTILSNNCYLSIPASSSRALFSYEPRKCIDVEYCIQTINCEHCFGCIGLQHKKFCIFNQQYSEAEYWKKLDEIKCAMLERGEYGEFLPAWMASTYFWDSSAPTYCDADADFAKKVQANVFPPESAGAIGELENAEVVSAEMIPNAVDDLAPEQWIGKAIRDETLKRRFSFLPTEIALYKKLRIAPPVRHYTARIGSLFAEMNLAVFVETTCRQCKRPITTTKNKSFPNRTMYCLECYHRFLETK